MANYVEVLKKTIDGLPDNKPEVREKVYEKARKTVIAKLSAMTPQPDAEVIVKQKRVLETAIAEVEASYNAASLDEELNLDSVLDEMKRMPSVEDAMSPRAPAPEPAPTPEPAAAPEYKPAAHVEPQIAPASAPKPTPTPVTATAEPDFNKHQLSSSSGQLGRVAFFVGAFIIAIGIMGYLGWTQGANISQAVISGLFGGSGEEAQVESQAPPAPETEQVAEEVKTKAEDNAAESKAAEGSSQEEPAVNTASAIEAPGEKFNQRLTEDGTEIDEGPAEGVEPPAAEGTSVAAQSEQSNAATQTNQKSLPIGQRALFYEEASGGRRGTKDAGAVLWSIEEEAPGDGLPPEPVIRGDVRIPESGISMRMSIRRNVDASIPASHILEFIFSTPDEFQGGSIQGMQRVNFKVEEAEQGNPLFGEVLKIGDDSIFLLALNDSVEAQRANLGLMANRNWIDVPVTYRTGRRALISFEKGTPGAKVFTDALTEWQKLAQGG